MSFKDLVNKEHIVIENLPKTAKLKFKVVVDKSIESKVLKLASGGESPIMTRDIYYTHNLYIEINGIPVLIASSDKIHSSGGLPIKEYYLSSVKPIEIDVLEEGNITTGVL